MKSDNDTNVATENLITEARELCENATKGPWEAGNYGAVCLKSGFKLGNIEGTGNAAFIARSRTLIPELCDALEKAGTEIERLNAEANEDYSEIADTMAGLMGEIERLREAQRWIPVSERLPTERGYYLVVVKRIAPDELGGNNTRVKIMRWMGEDWRYPVHIPEWINEAITETVTHWQPLPKPPRGDAND